MIIATLLFFNVILMAQTSSDSIKYEYKNILIYRGGTIKGSIYSGFIMKEESFNSKPIMNGKSKAFESSTKALAIYTDKGWEIVSTRTDSEDFITYYLLKRKTK